MEITCDQRVLPPAEERVVERCGIVRREGYGGGWGECGVWSAERGEESAVESERLYDAGGSGEVEGMGEDGAGWGASAGEAGTR